MPIIKKPGMRREPGAALPKTKTGMTPLSRVRREPGAALSAGEYLALGGRAPKRK